MSATPGANTLLPQRVREGVFDLSSIAPHERHWWTRGFASRVLINGTGVTVEYSDSRSQSLRWDNPNLEFYLVDYRAPVARNDHWGTPAQAKRTPFSFFPGPFGRPSTASTVWITEEAYKALYDSGFAARLHVNNGMGRGYSSDAIITVFRRKSYTTWTVKELNANAG